MDSLPLPAPPKFTRDLIPDNAYVLKKYFKDIRKHEINSSQPHSKPDRTYEIMRQRGQISGLLEALEGYVAPTKRRDYSLRNPNYDLAEKLGVSGYKIPSLKTSSIDYLATRTINEQKLTYVSPQDSIRYRRGLDEELFGYEV